MQPDVILFFNGVQLSKPCEMCKGDGEITQPEEQRSVCPHCHAKADPIEPTPAENETTVASLQRRISLRCPKCGGHGDEMDWGLIPSWCVDCEGSGRTLTPAGVELLTFIDALRPKGGQ